ncbi:MAG: hypothetical protein KatS3mg077_1816 [Candidatus Binatia bacterium]|nr:MAG: hypothetical protein KatS3mg077_1816 [Candidatus Binatia bacterium]
MYGTPVYGMVLIDRPSHNAPEWLLSDWDCEIGYSILIADGSKLPAFWIGVASNPTETSRDAIERVRFRAVRTAPSRVRKDMVGDRNT